MIPYKRTIPRAAKWVRQSYYGSAAERPWLPASFYELASALTPTHGQVQHLCGNIHYMTSVRPSIGIVWGNLSMRWELRSILVSIVQALWERGYTVIDSAFSKATCQAFREEVLGLKARGLLHLNSTHLVKGNVRSLLQKHGIFEAEVAEKVSKSASRALHGIGGSFQIGGNRISPSAPDGEPCGRLARWLEGVRAQSVPCRAHRRLRHSLQPSKGTGPS